MHVTGDNIYIWLFLVYLLCGHRRESVVWQYEHVTYVKMFACLPVPRDGQLCSIICTWQATIYTYDTLKVYLLCGDRRESVAWQYEHVTYVKMVACLHIQRDRWQCIQKDYRVYWKRWVYEHMTCVNMLACSPVPRDGQLCSIICTWQVTLYTGNTLKVYALCGDRRESVVAVWACDMWQYVCLFTCTALWAVV